MERVGRRRSIRVPAEGRGTYREHSVEGVRPCHTSTEAIGPAIILALEIEARINSWLLSWILLEKGRPASEIRSGRVRSLSQ